jgi:Arc/MetJ family transcription regulator
MATSDELADNVTEELAGLPIMRAELGQVLRDLARDAAKHALLDAAEEAIEFSPNGRYVAEWLRARTGQIGN